MCMNTQHTHDCDSCIFLGNFGTVSGTVERKFDVYFCPTHGDVVARFGSDGPAYFARPYEAVVIGPRSDIWQGVYNLLTKKSRP
jgi:hypothetical protein